MTDTPIIDPAVATAPKQYKVTGAQDIVLKGVTATYDGSGAGGSFVPAVQIIDPAGNIIGTYTLGQALAAGASADVSWFPGVTATVVNVPIGPTLSGNTIVPTAVITGVRSVQPTGASFGSGIEHDGFRVIIPQTGVLHDLSVFVTAAAGSIEVAILNTVTPTRTILYKTGYVAVPGSHQWFTVGDPAMAVTVGDQLDISIALSTNACTVFWIGGLVNSGVTDAASGHLPAGFIPVTGGAPPKLTWTDSVSPVPYGVTTTVAEASLTDAVGVPLVIGRIV